MKCEKLTLQKIIGNLLYKLRKKIVHGWNGHVESFSHPQLKENFWQYLLLRTDKTVVGCPCIINHHMNAWIKENQKKIFYHLRNYASSLTENRAFKKRHLLLTEYEMSEVL